MTVSDFLSDDFDSLGSLPSISLEEMDTRFIRQAITIHLLSIAGKKKNSNLVFQLSKDGEVIVIDSEEFTKDMHYVCFLDNMGIIAHQELSELLPEKINIATASIFISDINNKYHGIVDEWIDFVYDEFQSKANETFLEY